VSSHSATVITVLLWGMSGLLLLSAAGSWSKVARQRDPELRVTILRNAAATSTVAFVMLGVAAFWRAFLAVTGWLPF
jgi:cytochrome c-type biogenesis protein CcmH/NrfF